LTREFIRDPPRFPQLPLIRAHRTYPFPLVADAPDEPNRFPPCSQCRASSRQRRSDDLDGLTIAVGLLGQEKTGLPSRTRICTHRRRPLPLTPGNVQLRMRGRCQRLQPCTGTRPSNAARGEHPARRAEPRLRQTQQRGHDFTCGAPVQNRCH
jgi:hypothetical protein